LKELGETAYKEYGPMFRVWLTVLPSVVLLQPEHLQVGSDTSITVEANIFGTWQQSSFAVSLHARGFLLRKITSK
jgi:hypothetical protein